MGRRVEERRGGGGGEGRRFGVLRGGISEGQLDLRSSFGLCYCGRIEGTLLLLFLVAQKQSFFFINLNATF